MQGSSEKSSGIWEKIRMEQETLSLFIYEALYSSSFCFRNGNSIWQIVWEMAVQWFTVKREEYRVFPPLRNISFYRTWTNPSVKKDKKKPVTLSGQPVLEILQRIRTYSALASMVASAAAGAASFTSWIITNLEPSPILWPRWRIRVYPPGLLA